MSIVLFRLSIEGLYSLSYSLSLVNFFSTPSISVRSSLTIRVPDKDLFLRNSNRISELIFLYFVSKSLFLSTSCLFSSSALSFKSCNLLFFSFAESRFCCKSFRDSSTSSILFFMVSFKGFKVTRSFSAFSNFAFNAVISSFDIFVELFNASSVALMISLFCFSISSFSKSLVLSFSRNVLLSDFSSVCRMLLCKLNITLCKSLFNVVCTN